LGLSVLYQAWNEAVGKCGQMLSAQILDGSDETRNVVGDIGMCALLLLCNYNYIF
jgi:hypothetical protein